MFRKILQKFSYLVAGLALAVQIFVILAKTNFFFELFTHYALYYAIFWSIFALICATRKHFACALILTLIASINIAEISPYFARTEAITTNSQANETVTILSNNFYYKNQNTDDFLELIKEENPDIFIVHEAGHIWISLLSELIKTYPSLYLTKETGVHGILIGSKTPGIFTEIPLGEAFGLEFIPTNGAFKILAVHPEAPFTQKFAKARNTQFQDITTYIRNQNDTNNKIVIIGDFNCTPWSPYFTDLLKAGLKDAQIGFGLSPTWHSGLSPFKIQIDHALVTDSVAVDSFKVLRQVAGADHLPIEVKVH
ncbi:MAG: endonuclease/exonuclease/phosphatase family protein [Candidatus Gracilibacteria bacterium]